MPLSPGGCLSKQTVHNSVIIPGFGTGKKREKAWQFEEQGWHHGREKKTGQGHRQGRDRSELPKENKLWDIETEL